ncbi:hypothetical protein K1W54_17905 [Micromonospora sp. CPCC 205371]|nr:hypothetical protein [Micromonospora sp. CPCC 205371]
MDDAVELADLIWQLRHELSRAMWAGENADLKFRAESVELELTVGLERVREPGVKVRFWVFDAGAGGKRAATTTQTIRLTLSPIQPGSAEQPAIISDDELSNED